jgi:hypoxanthine phosphoribosyltransferase
VEIEHDENLPVDGRDVLIVDDVYDTGRTLKAVTEHLRARGACEIRTCVLLEKDKEHEVTIDIDFLGTMVDDRSLVGYGLDLDGEFRDLPYVGYADGNA